MQSVLRPIQNVLKRNLQSYAGKSYWVARYRDRDDIYEWDCDWSLLPRKGLTELVLCAPGGQCGVLGHASGDISDRALQFKIASTLHGRIAQVVGLVLDGEGHCVCYAYDDTGLVGPFEDNISPGSFSYGGNAMYSPSYEVLGIGTK